MRLSLNNLSKFKKDVLVSYFAQGVALSTSFLNFYLITNLASLEVYGQYAVLAASLGFISAIVMVRSGEAVVKFYKTEMLRGNPARAKAFLVYGFSLDLLTAVFLMMLVFLATGLIAEHLLKDAELESVALVFSVINVSVLLRGTCLGYFQSREEFTLINGLKIYESMMISLALFIFLRYGEVSLESVLYAYIASYSSTLLLFFVFFLISIGRQPKSLAAIEKDSIVEFVRFNFVTFFSSALKAGNKSYDGIVLAYFTSPAVVGIYTILKKFFMPADMLVQPFRNILYPKIVTFWEGGEKGKLRSLIRTVSLRVVLVIFVYGLVLYGLSGFIFEIFKISGQADESIILLFTALYTLTTSMWWTRIFSNTVNPMYSLHAGAFSAIYQIIISTLAVYYFGMLGLVGSLLSVNVFLYLYWRNLLVRA